MGRPPKVFECPECHRQTRLLENGICHACSLMYQAQQMAEADRLEHDASYVPTAPGGPLEPVPPVDNSVFSPGTVQAGQAQALWEQLWTVDDRIEALEAERTLLMKVRLALKDLAGFYERWERYPGPKKEGRS